MPRVAAHDILPLFINRSSPRAMSGAAVDVALLNRLLEAARWAPSAGNSQPWRFVVTLRDTPAFATMLANLDDGNRAWCVRAGALIAVVSRAVLDNGKPTRTHAFDTGAAWISLALQGSTMGLVIHAMAGFDMLKVSEAIGLPPDHAIQCVVAVGHPGSVEDLPEHQRPREAPSDRKSIESFVLRDAFPLTT